MIQFLALCWCIWLMGWNDGTIGPMLPRIQTQYRVGFSVVSMIFVGNCAGYITGATLNVWLNDRYGFGKAAFGSYQIIVLGAVCQLFAYAILISAPPFPLIICAYVIVGFGMSLQNAQSNGFVASLHEHMSVKLGMLHASYGLGAFISPFSSTYFSGLSNRRWAFHFILSAGFSLLNILVLIYIFRFRRQEEILLDAGQEANADSSVGQQGGSTYRQIFSVKAVPFLAIFALIYIGVEVSLGGGCQVMILRLHSTNDDKCSAGYISSGFFGGRVSLIWLNQMVGERRIIFIYTIIAIGLELTVWFVPSIIGNAVSVSLIGVVLGPMFPLLVSHMTHILPRWLLTACVGLVAGIGMAGSAALPFVTGILASKYGIGSLQPLMISMMGCMLVVWGLVPSNTRRVD
ncbi:MFS general substrate transporter [Flammula alnicola]|nr:MFS general substrate transporter [Flammula alnicola]